MLRKSAALLVSLSLCIAFMTGCGDGFRLTASKSTEDMTETIQKTLNQYGVCELPPGVFHVTGLVVPQAGMLRGSGNATKLVLDGIIEDGAAIRISSEGCVRDLQIIGAEEKPDVKANPGSRHGILFEGNADADGECPVHATIENVSFLNFTGGAITCRNTGYSVDASLNVTNCYMTGCGVGINIPFWSEYNRFTNVSATRCGYGCINNGGNNIFVNCNFSGNNTGLLMDNSTGEARNNSHGSFVGCTFNHSGENEGYAIKIQGMSNGEVFSGCQIFFGKTLIIDSKGIQFAGCIMGRGTDIHVKDSSAISFSDCMMWDENSTPITTENSESVYINNCYSRNGTPCP